MDLFKQPGKLNKRLGDYPSKEVSPKLSWEQMSAGILDGVAQRRRKRRFIIWWWFGGAASLLLLGYILRQPTIIISALPIPMEYSDLTNSMGTNIAPKKIEDSSTVIKDLNSSFYNNTRESHLKSRTSQIDTNNEVKIAGVLAKEFDKLSIELLPKLKSNFLTSIPTSITTSEESNFMEEINISELPNLDFAFLTRVGELLLFPKSVTRVNTMLSKWQLELSAGMTNHQPNYQSTNSENQTPSNFELSLTSWQANLRVKRSISKKWHLSTGLQYQSLRYRSSYFSREEVNLYRPNTIDTIFSSSITDEKIFSYRDSIPGIITRNFQHYNEYRQLQIPILIGYGFYSNRLGITLQGGANFGIYQFHKGRTLVDPNEIIELSDQTLYKNVLNVSLILEGQLNYQLSTKSYIFTNVGYQHHLINWINPSLNFSQKPRITYVNLGLGWKF